jgi:hypothetical protein
LSKQFWVILAKGSHPFPSRTRKLSPSAPMVLHAQVCGRVGRRPIKLKKPQSKDWGFLLFRIKENSSVLFSPFTPARVGRVSVQWFELPTVVRAGPYRLFFYSADRDEPAHVHVEREEAKAKFWLEPVRLETSRGFGRAEIVRIERLVAGNAALLLRLWHEYFGR